MLKTADYFFIPTPLFHKKNIVNFLLVLKFCRHCRQNWIVGTYLTVPESFCDITKLQKVSTVLNLGHYHHES